MPGKGQPRWVGMGRHPGWHGIGSEAVAACKYGRPLCQGLNPLAAALFLQVLAARAQAGAVTLYRTKTKLSYLPPRTGER